MLPHGDANLFDTGLFFTPCKLGVTFDGSPRGLFLGSTETTVGTGPMGFSIPAGFLGKRKKAAALS